MDEKIGNIQKKPKRQTYLITGGGMIRKILKSHLFPEGVIYTSLLAIVQMVLLPCTMCIQRRSTSIFCKISTLNACILKIRWPFKKIK